MEQQDRQAACQCGVVERVLNMRIDGLEHRLKEATTDVGQLNRDVDGHVGDLWKHLRESIDEINKTIADHTTADNKAMHTIETQLLARVPAWALSAMTIGASIIGAMATYILDHIK